MFKPAIVLAAALVLGACTDTAPPVQPVAEMAAVCVAAESGLRADDGACDWDDDDDDDVLFFPYFYPAGHSVHPVGHKVSGGSRVKPHVTVKIYRAPPAGGKQRVYTVPGGPRQQPAVAPAKAPAVAPAKPAAPPAPAKPFNPPPRPRR